MSDGTIFDLISEMQRQMEMLENKLAEYTAAGNVDKAAETQIAICLHTQLMKKRKIASIAGRKAI